MEANQNISSRKRKICDDCKQDFSCRQYLRHRTESNCKGSAGQGDDSSEEDESESAFLQSDTDSEEYTSPTRDLRQIHMNFHCNLEVEDQLFFDAPEQVDNTGNSDDDSTDEECIDVSESSGESDIESETEGERGMLLQWVKIFFLLWQSWYCISDVAVNHILWFLRVFLLCLGKLSKVCIDISKGILKGIRNLRRNTGKKLIFRKFVVCTKCKSLYDYEDCILKVEGEKVTKLCPFVEFPNHPRLHLRRSCNQPLLKKVCNSNGEVKLIPHKVYHYQSLKSAFKRFINRSGFEKKCEEWRQRQPHDNILTEVYDGQIWKDFCDKEKHDFLNHENNYALMLNVDWFQPFKHVNYSVGAVYMVFLNLPIRERFKRENVILVGVIPNLDKEPATNTFLQPLVEELLQAWTTGFSMTSYLSPKIPKKFRLALLCCGCDIPASRKVCGFLGHMAKKGCNKCHKVFPGMVGDKSFGGFDRNGWETRDLETHRRQVDLVRQASSKEKQKEAESRYGVRYSVLLELPYFDPIRMSIIDPMHNLFLGTAKHQMRVWKDAGIVDNSTLDVIQKRVDMIHCPTDLGNIPHKVGSGFSNLTADQLKNWTLVFSMFALLNILNEQQRKCWQKFVLACRWLCSKILTVHNVQVADNLLLAFCQSFERLYGEQRVTPNMHLHCHLAQCILDFGPIYGFWLFSFERYNGILGNYPTNKREIEAQLFKRFIYDLSPADFTEPTLFQTEMEEIFKSMESTDKKRGSLLMQSTETSDFEEVTKSSSSCVISEKKWDMSTSFLARVRGKRLGSVTENEMPYLRQMYKYLYGALESDSSFIISPSYMETNEVYYLENTLGSKNGRSKRSSMICAHWCSEDGIIHPQNEMLGSECRAGQVQKYVVHKVIYQGQEKQHILAKVHWHADLPQSTKSNLVDLKPTQVWSTAIVLSGSALFIPIQRIKCRAVHTVERHRGKNILFVCSRDRYLMYS